MNRLSLQPLFTNALGANDTSSGLSHRLWSRIRNVGSSPDGGAGIFIADDFMLFGQSVAVSSNVACYVSQAGQYKTYEDTSTALAQSATLGSGGFITISLDATNNHEVSICQGGAGTAAAVSVLGALNRDSNPKLTVFEARWKVSSIADDVSSFFIGLMEENGAVHNAKVDDTGAVIDNDYIGFNTLHTNGGTTGTNALLNCVYKKDGATAQTSISSVATLAADTYIKTGFVYDPYQPPSKRIAWFVNNVEQSTYVTDDQMNASTFPDGEEMGFTAIAKSGTDTASTATIDWWAFYQEL